MSTFSSLRFLTPRAPVIGTRGMVASTQPLASEAGLRILQQGGNAADAAVAVAASLNVTEPCSTGIGGDACALFYSASRKEVEGLLGFGRSGAAFTAENVRKAGFKDGRIPIDHGLLVTVPGAAQLWEDVATNWGTKSLTEILVPAIELCESGFPVTQVTAEQWSSHLYQLKGEGCSCFKTNAGKGPIAGEIMKNPALAETFKVISDKGTQEGFYRGKIAESITAAVRNYGGILTLDDLASHRPAKPCTPASTSYKGYTVWEIPPPSQGVVVLAALNHFEELSQSVTDFTWGSEEVLHAQIESLRLAFFDALGRNADPSCCDVPVEDMTCKREALRQRSSAKLSRQASKLRSDGGGGVNTDTVYFCVVDGDGNACSFINSNFNHFGTGIVPKDCGFSLHNRGHGFCTLEGHPNSIGPSKRPYNTIIPGMCTHEDGRLFCAFGVMGGFMQPQGHLQTLSNLIDFTMNPQAALDAPRFSITEVDSSRGEASVEQSRICLESGFADGIESKLIERGHNVHDDKNCFFGRGQIIVRTVEGVLWGGSDARADGVILGY